MRVGFVRRTQIRARRIRGTLASMQGSAHALLAKLLRASPRRTALRASIVRPARIVVAGACLSLLSAASGCEKSTSTAPQAVTPPTPAEPPTTVSEAPAEPPRDYAAEARTLAHQYL